MSSFKIRGFPEADGSEKIPEMQTVNAEHGVPTKLEEQKKKRGPYKKKVDKEAEKIAAMTPMEKVIFALKDIKGAPNHITLGEWKDLHGIFYMSSIDGVNVYIWKTLKRNEYKQLLTSGAAEKPGALEEFVVRRCLLYPRCTPEFLSSGDAGVISTLFKQIYYKSGFISDEEAMMMIEKI